MKKVGTMRDTSPHPFFKGTVAAAILTIISILYLLSNRSSPLGLTLAIIAGAIFFISFVLLLCFSLFLRRRM